MKIKQRNAFTLIELLFVIVILGIIGGIALEVIRQYYENIYRTQEYTKRVAQADQILDQVSKYFENAISSSIVNLDINPATVACYGPPEESADDFTIAFMGVDSDSLRGTSGNRPGWSEDTLLMTGNELNASDANYTMADTIITALGSTLRNSAIYDADSLDFNACVRFNFAGEGKEGFHKLDGVNPNPMANGLLRLNNDNNASHGDRKYLLRTGYAFRVDNNGNFWMHSNFRPWVTPYEHFSNAFKINLLGRNVAHFYADYNASDFQNDSNVTDRGLVWRLKVCMRGIDANLSDTNAESQAICRERRVHVRY